MFHKEIGGGAFRWKKFFILRNVSSKKLKEIPSIFKAMVLHPFAFEKLIWFYCFRLGLAHKTVFVHNQFIIGSWSKHHPNMNETKLLKKLQKLMTFYLQLPRVIIHPNATLRLFWIQFFAISAFFFCLLYFQYFAVDLTNLVYFCKIYIACSKQRKIYKKRNHNLNFYDSLWTSVQNSNNFY